MKEQQAVEGLENVHIDSILSRLRKRCDFQPHFGISDNYSNAEEGKEYPPGAPKHLWGQ